MANESVITKGTYASFFTGSGVADGGFPSISAALNGTVTDATEQLFPLLDFKLAVTSGVPTENATVDLYRVPSDGTDDAPTPVGAYLQQYVGSFVLDDAGTTEYYLYGVSNVDDNDKFIVENNSGATLDFTVSVRARGVEPGA